LNPAEFENIARAEERLWWYRGMNRILFRLIDQYAPVTSLNVLEAGSGTGYITSLLEDRYRWRVHAIDISPEGLKYSKSRGLARLVRVTWHLCPLLLDTSMHFCRWTS